MGRGITNTNVQDTASEGLKIVLKKMCQMVGCEWETFDFNQEKWYSVYTWTKQQEDAFADWLEKELKKNKKIRDSLSRYPAIVKNNSMFREKTVNWFLLDYGWKTK